MVDAPPDANKDMCWIDMGPHNVQLGFTMSKKALRKQMAKDGHQVEAIPFGAAACTHIYRLDALADRIFVVVDKKADVSEVQAAALIVHECTHVVQHLWEKMRETVRCEAEAYCLQYIFQQMYLHWRMAKGLSTGEVGVK